jgi:hypothetical protein
MFSIQAGRQEAIQLLNQLRGQSFILAKQPEAAKAAWWGHFSEMAGHT